MLGTLIGLWSSAMTGSGPATIADQTVEFGALTPANYGGAKLLDSNGGEVDVTGVSPVSGTTSGWTHSGGRLIRSTATPELSDGAVLACTTALGTVNVTIKSSGTDVVGNPLTTSFSVKDGTELGAVATTANVASAARSILMRPGNYTIASSCFLNKAFANRLTITRAQSTKPIVAGSAGVAACIVENTDNLTFSQCKFYVPLTLTTTYCLVFKELSEAIQVYDCDFYSDEYDITIRYPSVVPTNVSGIYSNDNHLHSIDIQRCTLEYFNVGINIAASTTINIDGCTIRALFEDAIKIAATVTYPTVTIRDNLLYDFVGNSSDVGAPHCDGIQFSANTTIAADWTTVTIERNRVINTENAGGSIEPIFCRFYNPIVYVVTPTKSFAAGETFTTASGAGQVVSAIDLNLTVNCTIAFTNTNPDQIVRNGLGASGTLRSAVSTGGAVTMSLYNVTGTFSPTDTLTGDTDGSATLTSFGTRTMSVVNKTGTISAGDTITGSGSFPGLANLDSITRAVQYYFAPTIRDNLCYGNSANNITVASPGNGTLIENNTCVGPGPSQQNIVVGEYGKAPGASVIVRDNITENVSVDADVVGGITETNNIELGPNGATIAYSAVFDGISGSFEPQTPAEALTMFSRKAGGNADREPTNIDAGAVGTGYVDFSAGTSDNPRRESGFDASSGSWYSGTARQITGISSTGALVTISTGTFDVLASDGITVVASNQTSYVVSNNQYVRPDNTATITVGSTSGTVIDIPDFAFLGSSGTATNTTIGNTFTHSSVSLGTEHANRIIIVASATSSNFWSAAKIVVDAVDYPLTRIVGVNSDQLAIWAAAIPTGTIGDIVFTCNGSGSSVARHTVAWYAGYPASATARDTASGNASTTAAAQAQDLDVVDGGFTVFMSAAGTAGITYTNTWSGSGTITTDRGASSDLWEYESAMSATVGHILHTAASTTDDVSSTPSASTTTRYIVAASWGAS